MKRKISLFLLFIIVASLLAACGATATTAPAATTAPVAAATTAPVAAAATTAPANTAAARPTTAAAVTTAAGSATTAAASAATTAPAPTSATTSGTLKTAPGPIAPPADAKKGGTLTAASIGLSADLSPIPVSSSVTGVWANTVGLLWDSGLIEYNYTSLEWTLNMAKDMKVSEDGKTYTFTLKPDLKWSDGSAITPDDFVFTHENLAKPPTNQNFVYSRLQDKLLISSYKGDNATGTVTVTLDQKYNRDVALYLISNTPVPKKTWEGKPFFDSGNNSEIKKPTVVNGPYTLESYDDKAQGTFKVNPNWHRGKPNFDTIVIKSVAPTVIQETLKTGQADISLNTLPSVMFNDLKTSDQLNMYEWRGVQDSYRYIVFNTTAAPFSDKPLRQAIAHVVDRQQLIQLAEAGRAIPQFTFVAEASPYFNSEITRYAFNVDQAKKVLADGGYKLEGSTLSGKDGKPIKFTVIYDATTDITAKAVATYMQAQLKQIGIEVTVEGKDILSYLTALVTKKYDVGVGLVGNLNFPDPDLNKTFFISTGVYNVAGFALPRIDELFTQGSVAPDLAARKNLYGEVQKLLSDNVPSIGLYSITSFTAANKKIGGIVPNKGGFIHTNQAFVNWYLK